ncbi:hypothetical protein XA68_17361 [Ophiocordyceps unilateralis]|uniref:Uncharacterized protein n=1 Tax=Ophiocordyceps unilateralis TaxID=268505 RepID=A0A2A9PKN7_OPHUN|nr:hypothetical protein XA68_17361 [Ophiocordyceps unilateralis]
MHTDSSSRGVVSRTRRLSLLFDLPLSVRCGASPAAVEGGTVLVATAAGAGMKALRRLDGDDRRVSGLTRGFIVVIFNRHIPTPTTHSSTSGQSTTSIQEGEALAKRKKKKKKKKKKKEKPLV